MLRFLSSAVSFALGAACACGCNLVADLGGYEVVEQPSSSSDSGGSGAGGASGGGGHGADGGSVSPGCGSQPCTGAHLWSRRFGGSADQGVAAMAVDPDDGVAVVGDYAADLAFDAIPVGSSSSAVDVNVFVAALDASGVPKWAFGYGDAGDQHATAVAVAADGAVVFGGWFNGTLNFGGGPIGNVAGSDMFLVELDANGTHQWTRQFVATSDLAQVQALAIDADGNVYVGGVQYGAIDFGGGITTIALGGLDGVVAKLAPDGSAVWAQALGGPGNDGILRIAFAPGGDLVVLGGSDADINVGGGTLPAAGLADVWVARYSAALVHAWSRRYGGGDNDSGTSLVVDADDRIWIGGSFLSPTLALGGTPFTNMGSRDVFVAELDHDGDHLWSASFGDAGSQDLHALDSDGLGNVVLAGRFDGSIDFGGGPFASGGLRDGFLAKLGPAGQHRWSFAYGTPSGATEQLVNMLARDSTGNMTFAGSFTGSINVGGGPLTSVGASDLFVGRLGP
jgi:beta-propeller repeat-containing protein